MTQSTPGLPTTESARSEALVLAEPRLTDVVSDLRDFAITSFDVPLDRLAAALPDGIEPERLRSDRGEHGLVSAVTFRNLDFRVGFAPFVRIDAPQTNFRTYVRVRGEPAVFFFGTSFGSLTVAIPRFVWGLPWRHARHAIDCAYDDSDHCVRYAFRARGALGEEHVEAAGTGEPMGFVAGFEDAAACARILADPTIGFVRRRGAIATYGVDHAPLRLERAVASTARFELFERLGLVEPGATPSSVLVAPRSRFIVRLPPRAFRQ